MKNTILSIVPAAPGWFGVASPTQVSFDCPVAVWALCEDENGTRFVAGLCPSDDRDYMAADEDSMMSGYLFNADAVAPGASDPA